MKPQQEPRPFSQRSEQQPQRQVPQEQQGGGGGRGRARVRRCASVRWWMMPMAMTMTLVVVSLVVLPFPLCQARFVEYDGEDDNDEDSGTDGLPQEEKKCSIFIAPSSLLGNSGFGVYTTRDIKEGEYILSGPEGTPDGPSLTIIDPSHVYYDDEVDEEWMEHRQQWNNVFGHYWWGRGVPEHALYEAETVVDFQITFGALPNHHCILGSMEMHFPEVDAYDDSLANRFHDPGTGAYSYHRGRVFFATHDLPAGSEIFLSYGYCSRNDMHNPQEAELYYPKWTQHIPMEEDFQMATMAIRSLWNTLLQQTPSGLVTEIPDHKPLQIDDDPIVREFLIHQQHHTWAPHIVRALIPETTTQLKQIMTRVENNTNTKKNANNKQKYRQETSDSLARYLARELGTTPRTPEWVEEHGLCIEHLIPAPSTLPHAGRGGFAQHTIPAGDMVVPVPLLHITHKHVLYLLDNDGEPTQWQQLLTNYCFSHNQSTLALCPTSNVILINHCSNRTTATATTTTTADKVIQQHPSYYCPEGPNAKLQWASSAWDPRTPKWLTATIDEMEEQVDRLLAMEVIATREISPGEEVFLDYGVEWEDAWNQHVENWEPDIEEEEEYFFSIAEANRDLTQPLEHLVSGSFREEMDHPFIFTACLYWPTEQDQEDVYREKSPDLDLNEMTDEEIWRKYADEGSLYRGIYADPGAHRNNWWPCYVLLQDNDEGDTATNNDENSSGDNSHDSKNEITYLVRITQHPAVLPHMPWHENSLPRLLYYYPRSSIRYFAKPYHGDHYLASAFRHFIPIGDDIFPNQWRNNLQQSSPTSKTTTTTTTTAEEEEEEA